MIKLFKSVDDQLKGLGFYKIKENEYGVSYHRNIEKFNYIQRLDIGRKASGRHIIQSYQEGVNSDGFNNDVGLEYLEMKLALKKYKQLKRKYKWCGIKKEERND